jgi:hypothetical protein
MTGQPFHLSLRPFSPQAIRISERVVGRRNGDAEDEPEKTGQATENGRPEPPTPDDRNDERDYRMMNAKDVAVL